MLYMVIERFYPSRVGDIYQRYDEKGRMLPEGVEYINSWIQEDLSTCYQVMKADNTELLRQWADTWGDLAQFEFIPVLTSAEAREKALHS
jgi:hypothetical protein